MRVRDQLGRELDFDGVPTRIVSLVPSQTELLVDLGLEEQLVGITKFCVHPEHLSRLKTVVGGTKQVHSNRIAQLQPDIIIANKEENTEELVRELSAICPVWVSDIATLDQALEMIRSLGELFACTDQASSLILEIEEGFKGLEEKMLDREKLKAIYLIWNKPWMAAGKGTFIDHLLQRCGFENLITEFRYPEVTNAELEQADIVLLSSEPFPFNPKHVAELEQSGLKNVVLTDGEMWSWYGSRLVKAVKYLEQFRLGL